MSNLQATTTNATMPEPMHGTSRKRNPVLPAVIYHLGVILLSFLMIYPILWMFASSLKATNEIWTNVASLIPRHPVLHHYVNGWKGFGGITFGTFFKNSFIYAGLGSLAQVCSSALVAYAFARVKFKGRKIWFGLMLLTLMLPRQVLLIPQYIVFSKLGWINSFKPLLVPTLFGHPFFIFLMVQFMRGIPKELDEAAEIDGCSKAGIFFQILVPLIQPAVITAAIFSFYWTWSEFLIPLIYLNNPKLYVVSMALRTFSDPSGQTDWGAIFAMSSLSLVPVFVIFILFQKYIVEGISTSGLKG
jgi:multiple sugar transport system permease protein